jgi:hypothetical protein
VFAPAKITINQEIIFFLFFEIQYVFNVTETISRCPQITNLKRKECAKKNNDRIGKEYSSCIWNIFGADGS